MVTSALKNNAAGSPAEQSWEPAQATISHGTMLYTCLTNNGLNSQNSGKGGQTIEGPTPLTARDSMVHTWWSVKYLHLHLQCHLLYITFAYYTGAIKYLIVISQFLFLHKAELYLAVTNVKKKKKIWETLKCI